MVILGCGPWSPLLGRISVHRHEHHSHFGGRTIKLRLANISVIEMGDPHPVLQALDLEMLAPSLNKHGFGVRIWDNTILVFTLKPKNLGIFSQVRPR